MNIPKVSINDLISTAHPSAQTTNQSNANPASNFINMLAGYALKAGNAAGSVLSDVGNNFAAPVRDIGAYTKIQFDPQAKKQLDTINNSNLPEDQKNAQATAFMQKYGGESPDQMASSARGADIIMGTQAPAGVPDLGGIDIPAVANQAKNATSKGAQDVAQGINDIKATAQAQPGGLQAGFVKTGPSAAGEEGLPPIEDATAAGSGKTKAGYNPNEQASANPEKPAMITKNRADPHAIAQMQLNFDVPRRIAQNQLVKPDVVMNQLIEDGVTGRNLDDLQNTANSITGYDQNTGIKGAFPNINDHILRSIKDPLDYSPAVESKTKDLASVLEGEKPGFINEINKEVDKAMAPLNYNKPGELPSNLPENHAYAPDLFQTSQNLRNIARMYQRKALTDMGELNHPEMERAAKGIMEIKNNIDDVIDKNVPPSTYKAFKDDPYVQQQLQRMPANVAKRWMAGAERFKDGQAIQAPYVNLSNMIEDTKDTQLSVWTKAAKAMQSQNASGGVAQAVKENTPGPKIIKNIAGKVAQTAAKPFDKSADDIFEENMKGTGNLKGTKAPGGKAAKVVAGLGLVGGLTAAGAGLEKINSSSNAQSQNSTNESNNSHSNNLSSPPSQVNGQNVNTPIKYSDIPQDVTQIQPDPKTGQYTITSPMAITDKTGQPLAMSETDYKDLKKGYQQQLGTLEVKYNPQKSAAIQSQLDQLETTQKQSSELQEDYTSAQTIQNTAQATIDLLKDAPPNLFNQNGLVDNYNTAFNGKYAGLKESINILQKYYPVLADSVLKSANINNALTVLSKIPQRVASDYYQKINTVTGNVPGVPQNTVMQSATSQGLPPIGSLNNGGSVQGHPLASF